MGDEKTHDAVVRNLQTLAESTQRLSSATKAKYPEIDWRRIGRFRNVVVHDYLALDYERIWSVIAAHLEPLEQAVSAALASLDGSWESEN